MCNYDDCVLKRKLHGVMEGRAICLGLTHPYCEYGEKCSFYASDKTHYRDKKTGYVHLKEERSKNNETIHI